jgi:hypothetical protein
MSAADQISLAQQRSARPPATRAPNRSEEVCKRLIQFHPINSRAVDLYSIQMLQGRQLIPSLLVRKEMAAAGAGA